MRKERDKRAIINAGLQVVTFMLEQAEEYIVLARSR